MTDFNSWFITNENRSAVDKFKQTILCRNGHDNEYHYLKYKSGKISDFHDSAVCKRCKHLQLYGIPFMVHEMLNNG